MKKTLIRKIIAVTIATTTILGVSSIGASAEWKHNNDNTWSNSDATNGWFKDKNDWYYFKNGVMQTGWIQDGDKYYYLSSNGNMLVNSTTPDGYKVDSNGVWIQNNVNSNNTTSTNTDINSTSNSNNMTNLTNNIDNSTKVSKDITLNNTGSITNNTTNNYDVDITNKTDNSSVAKEIEKSRKEADERLKISYESSLEQMKDKLEDAKIKLEKVKSQKTNQVYKEVDGVWTFVYEADEKKVKEAEDNIEFYEGKVETYEKLLDSLDE